MVKLGFDVLATRNRIEEWCLDHFAHPLIPEGAPRPASRSRTVFDLLFFLHAAEHGVPTHFLEGETWVPAPICSERPCRIAGLAFALAEITQYETEARSDQVRELLQLERVARALGAVDAEGAMNARARARAIRSKLSSRVFRQEETGGRPRASLAQAVAQHLADGGFTHREVGEFMGATDDSSRKRVDADDARTIVPFTESGTPRRYSARRGPSAIFER